MKKTLIIAGFAALLGTSAMADGIGVSMAVFDDNFLTVLRNGIQKQADDAGLKVQIEDATNDVAKCVAPRCVRSPNLSTVAIRFTATAAPSSIG